ncbi:hypothetical protein COT42_02075 [Candidatus Saganbacteria bacterium CG08_land_8_20_14_0_20_45_16]|uniref:Zinc-binding protein n=1 Tax=Candidatus Saganbacteria bacterium CG08_land_8_20_14_0_20_45_16 TaxID=2014293 RepID=A0A2H0Y0E8_UNCSA|nr:MAG: hypothetical protein COT42_02075 [Candidatus Saganbacteria bacterium CG08_land_8_20_14_0_20_45_16]
MADCCGRVEVLIYPCSGAADVGELSDRVARKLSKKGVGAMACLAGVGAKFVNTAAIDQAVEMIDCGGCCG